MPRIIYSLKFDLGRTPNGGIIQLIAPLDPRGQSPHCKAVMPKHRVIDLREGDYVWHEGTKRSYIIKGIEAYRENRIGQQRLAGNPPSEGYVVRGS
jgi:hypothetical protein